MKKKLKTLRQLNRLRIERVMTKALPMTPPRVRQLISEGIGDFLSGSPGVSTVSSQISASSTVSSPCRTYPQFSAALEHSLANLRASIDNSIDAKRKTKEANNKDIPPEECSVEEKNSNTKEGDEPFVRTSTPFSSPLRNKRVSTPLKTIMKGLNLPPSPMMTRSRARKKNETAAGPSPALDTIPEEPLQGLGAILKKLEVDYPYDPYQLYITHKKIPKDPIPPTETYFPVDLSFSSCSTAPSVAWAANESLSFRDTDQSYSLDDETQEGIGEMIMEGRSNVISNDIGYGDHDDFDERPGIASWERI